MTYVNGCSKLFTIVQYILQIKVFDGFVIFLAIPKYHERTKFTLSEVLCSQLSHIFIIFTQKYLFILNKFSFSIKLLF